MKELYRRLIFIGVLSIVLGVIPLGAHEMDTGKATLSVDAEGVVLLEVNVGLSDFIRDTIELREDALPILIEFEESGSLPWKELREWEELFGLSEASTSVQVKFPEVLGEVILTKYSPKVEWVVTGERSEPLMLNGGESASDNNDSGNGFWKFFRVGYEHILPKGLDHILFVVGLFLLAARMKPLLWQVTAFTLAHTLTLGLSVYGLVSLSSAIVEPLIALSIAAIAIENVFTDRIHKWRPFVVFGFGLLHGLGFAGVLNEVGLPEGDLLKALFGFNVGVELGQLSVIALCLLSIGWFRNCAWYRKNLTVPLSIMIGVVGVYWFFARI